MVEYGMGVPSYLHCTLHIYVACELPGWKRVLHEKLIIHYLFQKFYFILWNLKFHHCLHDNSPLASCPEPDKSNPHPSFLFAEFGFHDNCTQSIFFRLEAGCPDAANISVPLFPLGPTGKMKPCECIVD